MEYVSTQRLRPGFFAKLFSDFAMLKTRFATRMQIARNERSLNQMTDRQLRDIGIPRHQIAQRAFEYGHAQSGWRA